MSLFLILVLSLLTAFSEANVATTENDPSSLVQGVSVITGDFFLQEEDIVIQGTEPIRLRRNYISQKGQGTWSLLPYHQAIGYRGARRLEIIEPNGSRLYYHWDNWKNGGYLFKLMTSKSSGNYGIVNTAKRNMSGRSNLKNQRIHMGKDKKVFTVFTPDGVRRVYHCHKKILDGFFQDSDVAIAQNPYDGSPQYYYLIKEELPNGHKILYDWPKKEGDCWMIRSTDASETHTYAWAKFHPHNGSKKTCKGDYGVETSDGRHFEYRHFDYRGGYQLKEVEGDERPKETLHYLDGKYRKVLNAITWEEGRSFNLEYYIKDKKDPLNRRVQSILAPVEDGKRLSTLYHFEYDLENKRTVVRNALGAPTIYYWNDDSHLIKIDKFIRDDCLHSREQFIWGKQGSREEGNLLCKIFFNEKEVPVQAISYSYDKRGNITREKIYGNLSGKGKELSLNAEGLPEDREVEVYTKRKKYSRDGKNLLLVHEEDNGFKVEFSYLDGTPLIQEERYYDEKVLKKRKVYEYDGRKALIKEVTEDVLTGNQLIQEIKLRGDEESYAGMPSALEDYYKDQTGVKLLKKIALEYGSGGRIQGKTFYDSLGNERYSLRYTFSKGRLEKETNPIGQEASYQYDALDNRTGQINFGGLSRTETRYDCRNRISSIEEITAEGLSKKYTYTYNALDKQIAVYDEYKNKTEHVYDALGRLIKRLLPDGGVILSSYDASGNEIAHTDAMGYTTYSSYNSYGKITHISYPDGGEERFKYYLDGTLKYHIDQKGLKTRYTYDCFQRVTSKQTPYTVETYTYDAFNLISQTDTGGCTTYYAYDGACRKISEVSEGEKISYEYDSLGRLYKMTQGDLSVITEYDLLNRVIEERKEGKGNNLLQYISYGYNAAGQRETIRREVNGKLSVESFIYDGFNRLIKQTDALGYESFIDYSQEGMNQVTSMDPLGLKTVRNFNAENKVISLEKYAPSGQKLMHDLYYYDLNQNLTVKDNALFKGSIRMQWIYDSMNRVTTLIEGLGKKEERVTRYFYTKAGLLEKTVKPSGVSVDLSYNTLGLLISQTSSDGSIHYSYAYDSNGKLLEAMDENAKEGITRTYDRRGRVVKETWPQGFSTQRFYDLQGRDSFFVLPDGSYIAYNYNALYLKEVSRFTKNGDFCYQHAYQKRDLSGNVLVEDLPLCRGKIRRTYDLLGRPTSIESPFFVQQNCSFDPAGNLLSMKYRGEELSYSYDDLYQLTEEKGHNYLYDSNYNRCKKDETTFEINALNQTSALDYNADGNPRSLEGKTFIYDALDRLIQIDDDTKKICYAYDAFQRRLSKKVYVLEDAWSLIEEVYYFYDKQNEIGSCDAKGTISELRILGLTSQAEIGGTIAIELQGKLYIPSHDLQGNIVSLYDVSGDKTETYAYSSFGEEQFPLPPSKNPWRFSSKRTDIETGLVYYGRRYYCPKIGRWLTPDPLGLEAGPNLYAFVSNSPLTHVDLYGLIGSDLFDMSSLGNSQSSCPFGLDLSFTTGLQSWSGKVDPLYAPEQRTPAHIYQVGTSDLQQGKICFVNGMNTTKPVATTHSSSISEYGHGIKVDGVYNPTYGISTDISGCILETFSYNSNATKLIKDMIINFKSESPSLPKMLWVVHSKGALTLHNALSNLSPENQQKCIVLAIAPARVIPDRMCFKSFNYASKRDIVPYASTLRYAIRAAIEDDFDLKRIHIQDLMDLEELIILAPDPDAKWFDHNFDSPTFSQKIKDHTTEYIKDYGGK